ncbi:MAG: formylglycine-generating enzyme family protein [Alphaproteobacteria bacterium]|nr:formylglycine-generating enzyme family protein [Alphaproteobacteria bacterium]
MRRGVLGFLILLLSCKNYFQFNFPEVTPRGTAVVTNAPTLSKFSFDTANISIQIENLYKLEIASYGILYDTQPNLTESNSRILLGGLQNDTNINGMYHFSLRNLNSNQTYYFIGFITYKNGFTNKTDVFSFKTKIKPDIVINMPTLPNDIDDTKLKLSYIITNPDSIYFDSIGFVYSRTNPMPTFVMDTVKYATRNLVFRQGNYLDSLLNLTPNAMYYIRVFYRHNNQTFYSNNIIQVKSLPQSVAQLYRDLVTVNAGVFTMGCTAEQDDGNCNIGNGAKIQNVSLSSYRICKFEVTQQLWFDVLGSNPSRNLGNLQRPVDNISWLDCQNFISRLNSLSGRQYNFLTEAQWEYAARGASQNNIFLYSGSSNLFNVSWYLSNSDDSSHVVGLKQPNGLGIYDLTGNVAEWCFDWYGNYVNNGLLIFNPTGPLNSGSNSKVFRGGSYLSSLVESRLSYRSFQRLDLKSSNIGLRLAHPN